MPLVRVRFTAPALAACQEPAPPLKIEKPAVSTPAAS
jgi:hypothetical protein